MESDILGGDDPYGASKSAADIAVNFCSSPLNYKKIKILCCSKSWQQNLGRIDRI